MEAEDILSRALQESMTRLGPFEQAWGTGCRQAPSNFEPIKAPILNSKAARTDYLPACRSRTRRTVIRA